MKKRIDFLTYHDMEVQRLQKEIKFIKDNIDNYLSKEIAQNMIDQRQHKIDYIHEIVQNWENYRQNLTGKEKNEQ